MTSPMVGDHEPTNDLTAPNSDDTEHEPKSELDTGTPNAAPDQDPKELPTST